MSEHQHRPVQLEDEIRSLGGLAPTWQLVRRGHGRRELGAAVRNGTAIRVRQGWYSLPGTPDHHLRAWRVGGRLTCMIGARELGIWTSDPHPGLHVSVQPDRSRLRSPTDRRRRLRVEDEVTVHWTGDGRGTRFLATPLRCLLDMIDCEPVESVVAAADCAIGSGLISRSAWSQAVSALPTGPRLALADLDPRSGSYPESIMRFRLHRAGIRTRSQVQVARGIRVDFVIDRRIIVEVDGADHADLRQLRVDRDRDLTTRSLGYRTLRYSGPQVLREWPKVLADIRAALAG